MAGKVSTGLLVKSVFGDGLISSKVLECLEAEDAKARNEFTINLDTFWNKYDWKDYERIYEVPLMLNGTEEQQKAATEFVMFLTSRLQMYYYSDPFVDDVKWFMSTADEYTKVYAIKYVKRAIEMV